MAFAIYTPEEFLKEIGVAFKNAQETTTFSDKQRSTNISRGRAHSISAVAEDLFAEFLSRNLPKENFGELKFFVDKPISFSKGRQPCYPDILICKELSENKFKIIYMLDIKTNTGWFRDGIERFANEEMASTLNNIVTSKNLYAKQDKIHIEFIATKNLNYDMVILSDKNNKKGAVLSAAENVNSKQGNIHVWVLCFEELNERYTKPNEQVIPNKEHFNALYNLLIKKINT